MKDIEKSLSKENVKEGKHVSRPLFPCGFHCPCQTHCSLNISVMSCLLESAPSVSSSLSTSTLQNTVQIFLSLQASQVRLACGELSFLQPPFQGSPLSFSVQRYCLNASFSLSCLYHSFQSSVQSLYLT